MQGQHPAARLHVAPQKSLKSIGKVFNTLPLILVSSKSSPLSHKRERGAR